MTPLTEVAYNPVSQVVAIVGLNGVVLTSKDGGEHWTDFKLDDSQSFIEVVPRDNEKGFNLLARDGQLVKFVPYSSPVVTIPPPPQGGCTFAPQASVSSGMLPAILFLIVLFLRRRLRIVKN